MYRESDQLKRKTQSFVSTEFRVKRLKQKPQPIDTSNKYERNYDSTREAMTLDHDGLYAKVQGQLGMKYITRAAPSRMGR